MSKFLRVSLLPALVTVSAILVGCSRPPSVTLALAPPGPEDLGPATGLSTPPSEAVAFDLKYLPQTGQAEDVQYFSYWGYGGSDVETKTNAFIQEVRKKAPGVHPVYSYVFTGRKWAAVEHEHRQAVAFYFDLNADGKLDENERILPTRKVQQGLEFITPDFLHPLENGGQVLCRALLQVNFYGGSEPNCMWSPAALLEGRATLNGRPARLLLYASNPGGPFDSYGSSRYSLLVGDQPKMAADHYVARESLSSLILSEGQFYRLAVQGRYSNGLPARVLLTKDKSATGELAVRLAGSNSIQAALTSLDLNGADDKTVFFRVDGSKDSISLPVGSYQLNDGVATYGTAARRDWQVEFSQGPRVSIKAGEVSEVALGQPMLKVRAIEEKDRYNREATECATFKQGTSIYLEPRIIGKNGEVFARFRQPAGDSQKPDRPPKVTITGPGGKQLLSSTMEYG